MNTSKKVLGFGGGNTTVQPRIIPHCMYAADCGSPLRGKLRVNRR